MEWIKLINTLIWQDLINHIKVVFSGNKRSVSGIKRSLIDCRQIYSGNGYLCYCTQINWFLPLCLPIYGRKCIFLLMLFDCMSEKKTFYSFCGNKWVVKLNWHSFVDQVHKLPPLDVFSWNENVIGIGA